MGLALTLDANLGFVLQPDYRHHFSAAELIQKSRTPDPRDHRAIWSPPTLDGVMLRPLQMQPDFLNQQAQLDFNCVIRLLPTATEPPLPQGTPTWFANPDDLAKKVIFEQAIGNAGNPWVAHAPVASVLPFGGLTPTGIASSYTINGVFAQSASGAGTKYSASALPPGPAISVPIIESLDHFPANQGLFFRWWQPPPLLAAFQTIYTFVFAQYAMVCRNAELEIYEDVSPAGDRSQWQLRYKRPILLPFKAPFDDSLTPTTPFGQTLGSEGLGPEGHYAHLFVIPYGRQKVLFLSQTGEIIVALVRAHPRRTMDGQEWDILRSGTVGVWALSAMPGIVQVQKVKYEFIATLQTKTIVVEYTPLSDPITSVSFDADAGSKLTAGVLTSPPTYTFPQSSTADDCPPPTNLQSALNRTYGESIGFIASADQRVSPILYSLDVVFDPVFTDSPATPTTVGDTATVTHFSPPSQDSTSPQPPQLVTTAAPVIMNAEISLGSKPGEGRARITVRDVPPHPLTPYQFRSEMPVQLAENNVPHFTGYTDRLEVQPLRGDANAPIDMRFRCNDRWLLLETTILREQRDWSAIGHVSVVDVIARQCGIDTGPLHADGTFYSNGSPVMSGGSKAEYPAGWDGAMSEQYNTRLGTPFFTPDMEEGNQLLGWKPQPHDTGATFINRISSNFSLWLVGFRADGTFYYLPYSYFTTSTLTFHAHAGRSVTSGFTMDASKSVGLTLFVNPGTATIDGSSVSAAPQNVFLPDNAVSTVSVNGAGTVTANPIGMPPAGNVIVGQATAKGGSIQGFDTSAASGRQTSSAPIFRHPLEYRTIEPSGNIVQVQTQFQLDQTANRSGLYVDYASIRNPAVVNYLGRPKWFTLEIGGSFSCSQLNWMAHQAFISARRRRQRVSFDATYVPSLKIGQIFTLEGIGAFRLLEMRATYTRTGWEVANYVGERVEKGYGLPS